MLLTAFVSGLLVLKQSQSSGMAHAVFMAGIGALIGTATELFSPSEYDTLTVPAAITAVLLFL